MHCLITLLYYWKNLIRLEPEQLPSNKNAEEATGFNKIGYNSFGKSSICSSFSGKSGGSNTTGNENLDSLLKTIAKDPMPVSMSMQESLNDVNNIRYVTHLFLFFFFNFK